MKVVLRAERIKIVVHIGERTVYDDSDERVNEYQRKECAVMLRNLAATIEGEQPEERVELESRNA